MDAVFVLCLSRYNSDSVQCIPSSHEATVTATTAGDRMHDYGHFRDYASVLYQFDGFASGVDGFDAVSDSDIGRFF